MGNTKPDGIPSACDCCGGQRLKKITQKRAYPIWRCCECGLYFVAPQPTNEELSRLYSAEEGYFSTAETDLAATSSEKAKKLHSILNELQVEPGRFHDVGCSSGKLIYQMQQQGWAVTGNDLNQGALEIARNNELDVFYGTLEDCGIEANSLDAIHLGDLIEHVRSPRALLDEIFRILQPGGVVSIVTPNADCGFAVSSLKLSKLMGLGWPHSEAPYHLYEFTPRTLTRLVEARGFAVEKIQCRGIGSFAYIVGATGHFDEMKKIMKGAESAVRKWGFWKGIPMLIGVTGLLLPFWIWGRLVDKSKHSGRNIRLWIRKPLNN